MLISNSVSHSSKCVLGSPDVREEHFVHSKAMCGHQLSQQPSPVGNEMAILSNSGGSGTPMADECNRLWFQVPLFDESTQGKIKAMTSLTASPRKPVDITMNYDIDLIYKKLSDVILVGPI